MRRDKYTTYNDFINKSNNSSVKDEHTEQCEVIDVGKLYVICNFDKLFNAARKEVIGK